MTLSVQRIFRVTTPNDAVTDLTEREARELAMGLLDALGIAALPASALDAPPVPATAKVAPPVALPSGPVAEEAPAPVPEGRGPLKYGDWSADLPELRRLMGEGVPLKEIAARLNRPLPATTSQFYKIKREKPRDAAPAVYRDPNSFPSPAGIPDFPACVGTIPPEPTPSPPVAESGKWTMEQTKALIAAMKPGHGGLGEASKTTGHTMGACSLRWRHLKAAGTMTLETYMSDPEVVPA